MGKFENDINNFVDNFIGDIVEKIDLGTLDNIFKGVMIAASILLLVLTGISLLFYKFFNKKGVRVTAYVIYSIWTFLSVSITFILVSLSYNWFNILGPIEGTVDPLIQKFRDLVNTTPTTKGFFEGFVSGVFGTGITLENISTQTVIKFILVTPLIIGWINIGFIALIMFSIIFGPKYTFIRVSTKVVYFIIFITLMLVGIWALVSSIKTDIKVATSIETLIRTQTRIITGGIADGLTGIKDVVNDFLNNLDDQVTEQNINDIINEIIKIDGNNIIIMGENNIKLDINTISEISKISPEEIREKIENLQQQFIDKGPEGAKEMIDNMKEWIINNLN